MNYQDGTKITVGDKVLYAGKPGRVVFVIDEHAFLPGYNEKDWNYLKKGIGVELQSGNLFCLDVADEDLVSGRE